MPRSVCASRRATTATCGATRRSASARAGDRDAAGGAGYVVVPYYDPLIVFARPRPG